MMEFPGKELLQNPFYEFSYSLDIEAHPDNVWPWIVQLGYHRGGWYIDTWWNKFIEEQFWPRVVPPEARGTYMPAAEEILPQFQNLAVRDTVPDGPPGSAYYEVVDLQPNRLLLLSATTHFNYMAPRFVYKTRFAPRGQFVWAFILDDLGQGHSRLTSWWQAEGQPRFMFILYKPFIILVDRAHQREILKGIKRRVEERRNA